MPLKELQKLWNKPHPFIFNRVSIIVPGICSFLIILIFAPFEFSKLSVLERLSYAMSIGLLSSFSIIMFVNLIKNLYLIFTQAEKWTIGRELILILLVLLGIIILTFLSFVILNVSGNSIIDTFLIVSFYTIGIGFIPILIMILIEQFVYQKRKLKQAHELTLNLRNRSHSISNLNANFSSSKESTVLITSENGNIELRLKLEEILFLKSDGNYVEIFYLNNDTVVKKLVRNRLKAIAQALPSKYFFQCHKSFIVNGNQIKEVFGNARNLELLVRGINTKVPVSRSRTSDFSEFLKSI